MKQDEKREGCGKAAAGYLERSLRDTSNGLVVRSDISTGPDDGTEGFRGNLGTPCGRDRRAPLTCSLSSMSGARGRNACGRGPMKALT